METRSLLLVVQFLISYSLIAQSWCAPGAVWTYRFDGWGADYRQEYRYLNDTLFDGDLAHKVQVTTEGLGGFGVPISSMGYEYSKLEDSIIWVWRGSMGWDTLYWLGAQPGDRWWPFDHPQSCPPEGMLSVLGTDNEVIDGITLTRWQIGLVNAEGVAGFFGHFIERIGMTPRYPFIYDCNMVIDYYFPHFICYSDNEIQVPSAEDCHITLSISDHGLDPDPIKIQPNPGSNFFQLTNLGDQPAQLRMLDLQGRTVLESQNVTDQQPIDVSEFRSGIYLIEIYNGFAGKQMLRWVKE